MLARKLGSQGIRVSSQGSKLSIHERRHYSPSRLKSGVGIGGTLGSDFKALRVTTSVGSFSGVQKSGVGPGKDDPRNHAKPKRTFSFVWFRGSFLPKGKEHEIRSMNTTCRSD